MDLGQLPVTTTLKAWPGACYAVYQHESGEGVTPILLDKLKLVSLEVDQCGPLSYLVSQITGSSIRVTVVPVKINSMDLAVSFPQRTYFERTLQDYGDGDIRESTSACIQAHHICIPGKKKTDGIPFMCAWPDVRKLYRSDAAYTYALNLLHQEVVVL